MNVFLLVALLTCKVVYVRLYPEYKLTTAKGKQT